MKCKEKIFIEFFLFLECGKCLVGNIVGFCGVMVIDFRDFYLEGGLVVIVDRYIGCFLGFLRFVEIIFGFG